MPVSKPAVVKIGNDHINFATINSRMSKDDSEIEENNRRIFEILNPLNKFSKSLIMDLVMKYKNIRSDYNIEFYNFRSFISKNLTDDSDSGNFSSGKIRKIREKIVNGDPVLLNTVRTALVNDTKFPLIVKFVDSSVNAIDFYFDSINNYGENKVEGIIIGDNDIINKNNLVLTAFVNMKYILNRVGQNIHIGENKELYHTVAYELSDSIKNSYYAAIIRDNYRIVATEKFMIMFNLLMKNPFSFINTTQVNEFLLMEGEEKTKNAINEFLETNKSIIDILIDDKNSSLPFKDLYNIFDSIDLNPSTMLSILEPSDFVISSVLNGGVMNHYASFRSLQNKNVEEEKVNDIKDTLMISRLLPLCFFSVYYLQNGSKHKTYQKIDESLEKTVHEKEIFFISADGTYRLRDLHDINDDYYNEIRKFVSNPMNTTYRIKNVIRKSIFGLNNNPSEGVSE